MWIRSQLFGCQSIQNIVKFDGVSVQCLQHTLVRQRYSIYFYIYEETSTCISILIIVALFIKMKPTVPVFTLLVIYGCLAPSLLVCSIISFVVYYLEAEVCCTKRSPAALVGTVPVISVDLHQHILHVTYESNGHIHCKKSTCHWYFHIYTTLVDTDEFGSGLF